MKDIEKPVIDAFNAAAKAGKPVSDCYMAAIAVWRARFPDHVSAYARRCVVSVILSARIKALTAGCRREGKAGASVRVVKPPVHPTRLSSL